MDGAASRPRPLLVGIALLATLPAQAAAPPRVRVDQHGHPLPPGAIARLGQLSFRHGSDVSALALSPDGAILATGGQGLRLRLWDVRTRREMPLPEHDGWVLAVAFSPDGKLVAWGSNSGRLRLAEVPSGRIVRQFPKHQAFVKAVAFSPDGKLLASGGSVDDYTIRIWDVSTGKERQQLRGHKLGVLSLAFAPDGKTLASGSNEPGVRLWDVGTGKELHKLDQGGREGRVAFSADGKLLASGSKTDTSVRLWDPATGKEVRALPGHANGTMCLAFAPAGDHLASTDGHGYLRLWDARTGKLLRKLEAQAGEALAWSRDAKTLLWPEQTYRVRLWKIDTPLAPHQGHVGRIFHLAFSPDGKTLASEGASGDGVLLWDPATGKHRRLPTGGDHLAHFEPDGKALVTSGTEKVRWWATATGRSLRVLASKDRWELPLAFSPSTRQFFANQSLRDGGPGLFESATGKELCSFPRPPFGARAAAFSPDGKTLATGGGAAFRDGIRGPPYKDVPIVLWDARTGKEVRRLAGHPDTVNSLAFSPDGRRLVSEGGQVRLWWAATGQLRATLKGCRGPLAVSPDGRVLACTNEEGSLSVVELATGEERLRFEGHPGGFQALAFRPDGKVLASGGHDSTILLWDLRGERTGPAPDRAELERLWQRLAGEARSANEAVLLLAAHPANSVPFLRDRLKPAADVSRRVERLIGELDDESFEVREEARAALEALGDAAEPAMRRALAKRPGLEARRRLERLLARVEMGALPGPLLREWRAVEALEQAGTAEARQLLRKLAGGAADAALTREAWAALGRLGDRR